MNVTHTLCAGTQDFMHEKISADSATWNKDIIIEKGAHLTFIAEHADGAALPVHLHYRFFVYDHAQLSCYFTLLAGAVTTLTLEVQLCGAGARADIKGLYVLDGSRTVTVTTLQHHAHKQTYSTLAVKGIVTDAARAVYHGTITIPKGAQQSEAYQENKNIVLSRAATVFSQPNLEIQTNDVRCKHGSAIGGFDAEQFLYMSSRGLSLERARMMLLKAFIADVLHPSMGEVMVPE